MKCKLREVAISMAILISPMLQAETLVYGVMINTADTPYWEAVEDALRESVSAEKADLYVQSPQGDDAELATQLCNSMLDRKPNVLLIATADGTSLSSCLDRAKSLNIPVVGISNSTHSFQNEDVNSVVLINQVENPQSVGTEAIEKASLAIDFEFNDDA